MMFTPVVRALLVTNLAFFLVDTFVFPLTNLFGLRYIFSVLFFPFQFATYMFLHADFSHILFNMLALFNFGPMLERFWGPKKFLTFYLVCGIGAGIVYEGINFYQLYRLQGQINLYAQNPTPDNFAAFMKNNSETGYMLSYDFIREFSENPESNDYVSQSIRHINDLFIRKSNAPLIGASGAVFGILMAFGMMFPQSELFLFPLPIPIKAWVYVTVFGIFELYLGVRASEHDNVAHFAHIGGMIFAYIMIVMWRKGGDYHSY
ncbi:MAG: rhomboid family intramembrane serine protease [Cytophagales bacterium]|nr:rhomboid family intramembrane serine protease [Cytophagales bacterium]